MNAVYAPGTVAVVNGRRALRVGNIGWHLRPSTDEEEESGEDFLLDDRVTDVHPLVALDPEDYDEVLEFVQRTQIGTPGTLITPLVEKVQRALRSYVKPPKPTEPETWGVVEASCVHNQTRREWVKHPDGNWWPVVPYSEIDRSIWPQPDDWSDLVDLVLIREGVTQ